MAWLGRRATTTPGWRCWRRRRWALAALPGPPAGWVLAVGPHALTRAPQTCSCAAVHTKFRPPAWTACGHPCFCCWKLSAVPAAFSVFLLCHAMQGELKPVDVKKMDAGQKRSLLAAVKRQEEHAEEDLLTRERDRLARCVQCGGLWLNDRWC